MRRAKKYLRLFLALMMSSYRLHATIKVSVPRIEYSSECHCDLRKISFVRELCDTCSPRFIEVRYHCRSAKSYRSSGPDLKARRAGRCAAGKTGARVRRRSL